MAISWPTVHGVARPDQDLDHTPDRRAPDLAAHGRSARAVGPERRRQGGRTRAGPSRTERAGVAGVDDLLDAEALRGAERRAEPVELRLELAGASRPDRPRPRCRACRRP
jgi:hypothetical protein